MAATDAAGLLRRMLQLVPLGTRPDGIPVAEAASRLGASEKEVREAVLLMESGLAGLEHGLGEMIQGGLEGDRIVFFATHSFDRPVRLLADEAVALGVGLRFLLDQASPGQREELRPRVWHLQAGLATAGAAAMAEGAGSRIAVSASHVQGDAHHAALMDIVRARGAARLRYMKPGSGGESEERCVEAHHLVQSEEHWYLLGWCRTRRAPRAFRLDRVMEVEGEDGEREGPSELEPSELLDPATGRVFRPAPDSAVEVAFRYSPRIARWIREREAVEEMEDGGCRARRQVADPDWAVSHVLQYGAEAWIESPRWMRERVVAALEVLR
jgi:proteasome accessory factor C